MRKPLAELQWASAHSQGRLEADTALAHLYAMMGRKEEAQKILAHLQALAQQTGGVSYRVAIIYAGLGEIEQAFTWLERAVQERHPMIITRLQVDPNLAPLRTDARFAELVQRVENASHLLE